MNQYSDPSSAGGPWPALVDSLQEPLGCCEKEFRCRAQTRQPEALKRHQSPWPAGFIGGSDCRKRGKR